MDDRQTSRAAWVVIGAIVGALAGVWTSTEPLQSGGLGALIAAILTSPSSARGAESIRGFLERSFLAGDIDEVTHQRLLDRLEERRPVAATTVREASAPARDVFAPPAPRMPSPPPPTPMPPRPVSPPAPVEPSPVVAPPPPPPVQRPPSEAPSAARRPTLERSTEPTSLLDAAPFLRPIVSFWRSLRADFGVQGLGSLGVLLVFTATLGFVIFAFSEVGTSFRPLAELMVPVVLFGLSGFLRRRSAPFMAAALEGLAGAVTPIMVFAAFMDGAPVPPDPERAGLVLALSAASLVLASIYAWASVRRSTSPLRYLVAPLVWLAVGVLGMSIDEEASAALFALVLVAVALTPWIPSSRPVSSLRSATNAMVVPGLVTAYTLLLVYGFAEGWPRSVLSRAPGVECPRSGSPKRPCWP